MDESLIRFIWRHTRREQLWVLAVVLVSLIPYYLAFDLPKQIVNGPIQGEGFDTPETTRIFLRIAFDLPRLGQVVLFDGFALDRVQMLMALSGTFLLLVIVNGQFKLYINTYKGRMGERLLRRVRYELIDRILRFPPQQFRRIKPAEAASMIKDEVEPLGGFTGDAFVQPVMLTGQALMAMVFICVQNLWLGAVAGGIAAIQIAIIPRMRRRLIRLGRERQLTARELSGRIGELMEGISTIHALDTTNWERADISARLGRIFRIRYELYQWKFMVKFLNNFLAQITPFIFYSFGGYLTIRGDLDVGQLVAVINAYKDLPGPLKELIDWDQARQDVQVKYEQVIEQFRAPVLIPPERQALSPRTGRLGGPIAVSGLVVEEAGQKLVDDVSLVIEPGETVAMIDDAGIGAETLAAVLGRAVWPDAGRVTIAGHPLDELPEHLLGRRLTYVSGSEYFFQASLGDNLLYGLRHAPREAPLPDDPREARRLRWELTEARASGNADYPVTADWIDRDLLPPDARGRRDLETAIVEALRITGLEDDVLGMGLRARITGPGREALKQAIVGLRARLRADEAAGRVPVPIEHFDRDRYNPYATVGENLLFGELALPFSGGRILRSDYAIRVMRSLGVSAMLFDLGREMARHIVELAGDDTDPDDTVLANLPFLTARDIPELRAILARTRTGGYISAQPEDRIRLVRLSLSYSEPQMRMGLLTPGLMKRIVAARARLAGNMPAELRAMITFYDSAAYNDAARVIDNILFGRIGRASPESRRRLEAMIVNYLREAGIERDILGLGLAEDIGLGGRRLSLAQRQRLGLARALVRHSEYYVFNKVISAVDQRQHGAIVEATLQALGRHAERPAVIWVLSESETARLFGRVIVFDHGSVLFDGSFPELRDARKSVGSLVFT